ncbi:MAG TPA: DUF2155 domain-containing protein [Caulobacteraceae bacterium]|jgi:hypothetical protein
MRRVVIASIVLIATAAGGLASAQVEPAEPQVPAAPPAPVTPAPAPAPAPSLAAPSPEAAAPPETASPRAPKPRAAPKPKVEAPPKRNLTNGAILQALDKTTAETMRFEAQVGRPVRYKGLIFTVSSCEIAPPNQTPRAVAHVRVDSQPLAVAGRPAADSRTIFRGWMFADAPGLNPLEHPVYDAWLIACRTSAPAANAGKR